MRADLDRVIERARVLTFGDGGGVVRQRLAEQRRSGEPMILAERNELRLLQIGAQALAARARQAARRKADRQHLDRFRWRRRGVGCDRGDSEKRRGGERCNDTDQHGIRPFFWSEAVLYMQYSQAESL